MFTEDELLPISALAHLEYCPRRCALIHVEGLWAENRLTAEGRILHDQAHQVAAEMAEGVRRVRALRLCSPTLGLAGIADVVEFHPALDDPAYGVALPGRKGLWRPFPVEYKRGRRRDESSYKVQLCAQAICLEEMLRVEVPAGALYYGQSKRRLPVTLDQDLRQRTRQLAAELHRLIDAGVTPPPQPTAKCRHCSLADLCLPRRLARGSAADYVRRAIGEILSETSHEKA